jgi:hypothetical protein
MTNPDQRQVPEASPEVQEPRSMNETETIAFLRERGVEPLPLAEYRPGQPILYVLEEFTRHLHFKDLPPIERPSIARLDQPTELDLTDPHVDEKRLGRVTYPLGNEGARVDYYTIDPVTKKLVYKDNLTSYRNSKVENKTYRVKDGNVFRSADVLFPKGTT